MNHVRATLFGFSLLGLAFVSQAQTYGPQDEGRRFDDGTVVRCHDVEVQKKPGDKNRVLGTVAGAVIGGVVGSKIGGGSGKKLATVGGAVAGGAAGRAIQRRSQEKNANVEIQRVCERTR